MKQLDELEQRIITCRKCDRLVAWREHMADEKRKAFRDQAYWGKPVPGFGDPQARVMVVGLAPGAHGSNRTGRMFTGDASGDFLYRSLHRFGFASQPQSIHNQDDLTLQGLFITAVCRCAPPGNKPSSDEIGACLPYLGGEKALLPLSGIVALGRIAFDGVLRLLRQEGSDLPALEFKHLGFNRLGPGLPWLLASYHPSRQNTQTGRLTEAMFDEVWREVRRLLDGAG